VAPSHRTQARAERTDRPSAQQRAAAVRPAACVHGRLSLSPLGRAAQARGESTVPPKRAPARDPPYWQSKIVRRQAEPTARTPARNSGGANARFRAEVCSRCGSPSPGCSPSGYRPRQRSLRSAEMRSGTGWPPGRPPIVSPTRQLPDAALPTGRIRTNDALRVDERLSSKLNSIPIDGVVRAARASLHALSSRYPNAIRHLIVQVGWLSSATLGQDLE
jgi:hypothetical protein